MVRPRVAALRGTRGRAEGDRNGAGRRQHDEAGHDELGTQTLEHWSSGFGCPRSTAVTPVWFPPSHPSPAPAYCAPVADLPGYVFEVDGDVAVPTELARGPWSPHAQHGGAPSALLAGQLEAFELGNASFPARFTLELMRPVPLTPLRIERQTIRPGKKVTLVQGSLFADDTEVVRATLLRLREQPVELAAQPVTGEYEPMPPPGPAAAADAAPARSTLRDRSSGARSR